MFKNTLALIVGLIVVVGLVFFVGLQLLAKFSVFLGNTKSGGDVQLSKSTFVLPPTLNPTYEATNTATIAVSGFGQSGQNIELFVNNNKVTTTLVDSDGKFSISSVQLQKGKNNIKAKAQTQDGKESDFTQDMDIIFDTDQPALQVDNPHDNDTVKDAFVKVSGKTDPEASITINNLTAIVDSNGNFSYNLPLNEGVNQIDIVATDKATNQTKQSLKVVYQK